MWVNKCNFLQLSLQINAFFSFFLVQQKLVLELTAGL